MSTPPDFEAFLRSALHAAADSVEPRGDGLERIRARLARPRPVIFTGFLSAWNDLALHSPAGLQDAVHRVGGSFQVAWRRIMAGPVSGRHRSATTQGWSRPLIAMGATVVIVAAGIYIALSTSSFGLPGSSAASTAAGARVASGGNSTGAGKLNSQGGYRQTAPAAAQKASPSPTCTSTPTTSPSPSSTPSTTPSNSPSASFPLQGLLSPSPSSTPSASPSSTTAAAGTGSKTVTAAAGSKRSRCEDASAATTTPAPAASQETSSASEVPAAPATSPVTPTPPAAASENSSTSATDDSSTTQAVGTAVSPIGAFGLRHGSRQAGGVGIGAGIGGRP